jgi:hypothetical protein
VLGCKPLTSVAVLEQGLEAALDEAVLLVERHHEMALDSGEDATCVCAHLIETISAMAHGTSRGATSAASRSPASSVPSGIQWDLSKIIWLVSCAVKSAEALTANHQAQLARLLVRDGLWPQLLRAASSSSDAARATSTFKETLIAWLAAMHAPQGDETGANSGKGAGKVGDASASGGGEAHAVAPGVWEEGLALVRCLKTGWKIPGGVGEREASEALEMAMLTYAQRAAAPAPALALILLDRPAEEMSSAAERFAGAPLPDEGLATVNRGVTLAQDSCRYLSNVRV